MRKLMKAVELPVQPVNMGGKAALQFALSDKIKMLVEYLPVLIFLAVALGFAVVMSVIPLVTTPTRKSNEKNSAYECGFEAFDSARRQFDVRFYLVAILFVIFDLEVAFLFPWALVFDEIGWFGFATMMIFLLILTIGFVYEWRKGALEWE